MLSDDLYNVIGRIAVSSSTLAANVCLLTIELHPPEDWVGMSVTHMMKKRASDLRTDLKKIARQYPNRELGARAHAFAVGIDVLNAARNDLLHTHWLENPTSPDIPLGVKLSDDKNVKLMVGNPGRWQNVAEQLDQANSDCRAIIRAIQNSRRRADILRTDDET